MAKTSSLTRLVGLVAAGLLLAPAAASADDGQILRESAADAIPGQYIVVLDEHELDGSTRSEIDALASEHGAEVEHQYTSAVQGFSAEMTREEALALSQDPAVKFVEQDRTFEIQATQTPTPSWGLDRIDQRPLPLNTAYTYGTPATNVTAYIIDTGIRTTHSDFGGRAVWGTNTTGDGQNTDCNGHGTHVAGTVGGNGYGVAKGVKLVAVKVLNCAGSGSFSGVVAGIDWVTSNHAAGTPAVANMSLGAAGSDAATESAVRNSIADGITYAIAAGNSAANSCNATPARVPEAITVGASTRTDARASFSNYGTCNDLFAPGDAISSAWNTNDTAANTISGTSMAAPHVAGAAALVLAATPNATPAAVTSALITNATSNAVTSPGAGTPNKLLFTGTGGTTPPPETCAAQTNGTDFLIPDLGTVQSPIAVTGCNRNASSTTEVTVNIAHAYIGDLVVELVAPNGIAFVLHNRAGGSADNINKTYLVNASTMPANGTWTLRARDAARIDTGKIDSWTIKL